jgi:hypothetical protein
MSTVVVDGYPMDFDAYFINDNNYFKLRDIALVLSGTLSQFEVGWDAATNTIILTTEREYTAVGGELSLAGTEDREATPTTSRIILDGYEISLEAYNIGGNNYFNLRDIAMAIDVDVEWYAESQTIIIFSDYYYTPDR